MTPVDLLINEIDAEKRQRRRQTSGALGVLAVVSVIIGIAIAALLSGCNTAGNAARIEQRKVVGVTSVTVGEYAIPVISISEGPSVSVYQTKDVPSTIQIEGTATTTNKTTALGLWDSEERKSMTFSGTFALSTTNGCDCATACKCGESCKCSNGGGGL
ncbi:MAG: hypothetical protein ACI4Q3_00680 [Kiritimatiellia bacterium]